MAKPNVADLRRALERILWAHSPEFADDHDAAIAAGHALLNSYTRVRPPVEHCRQEVVHTLRSQGTVQAVKLLRERAGIPLTHALEVVRDWRSEEAPDGE